jgi:hypothetical protein
VVGLVRTGHLWCCHGKFQCQRAGFLTGVTGVGSLRPGDCECEVDLPWGCWDLLYVSGCRPHNLPSTKAPPCFVGTPGEAMLCAGGIRRRHVQTAMRHQLHRPRPLRRTEHVCVRTRLEWRAVRGGGVSQVLPR